MFTGSSLSAADGAVSRAEPDSSAREHGGGHRSASARRRHPNRGKTLLERRADSGHLPAAARARALQPLARARTVRAHGGAASEPNERDDPERGNSAPFTSGPARGQLVA